MTIVRCNLRWNIPCPVNLHSVRFSQRPCEFRAQFLASQAHFHLPGRVQKDKAPWEPGSTQAFHNASAVPNCWTDHNLYRRARLRAGTPRPVTNSYSRQKPVCEGLGGAVRQYQMSCGIGTIASTRLGQIWSISQASKVFRLHGPGHPGWRRIFERGQSRQRSAAAIGEAGSPSSCALAPVPVTKKPWSDGRFCPDPFAR